MRAFCGDASRNARHCFGFRTVTADGMAPLSCLENNGRLLYMRMQHLENVSTFACSQEDRLVPLHNPSIGKQSPLPQREESHRKIDHYSLRLASPKRSLSSVDRIGTSLCLQRFCLQELQDT